MEIKQQATKQPMGHLKKSKEKSKTTYRQIKTLYQSLWDAAKAVLEGNFVAIQVYTPRKFLKFQTNNLMLHLKKLEKRSPKLAEGRK